MSNVITVPTIDFSAFYYPEILKALLGYFRRNRDELGLTDENDFETHVQLLRSFALVGHLNNTRLDTVANELLIDPARLLESVKRLLRLIGIELASATPAVVPVVMQLSAPTSSDVTAFVPPLTEFATDSVPPIAYEDLEGKDLDRTDQVSYVYGLEKISEGSNGFVATSAPDVFNKGAADPVFTSAMLNCHLLVPNGVTNNGGEFRIVEWLSSDQVRVVRVPGSVSPGFQTETGLAYRVMEFSVDHASDANGAGTFDPWTTPEEGDLLYVAHAHALWDQLNVTLSAAASNMSLGVLEYFDDQLSKFNPDSVTDNGDGTITLQVNSLLGLAIRNDAAVIVEHLQTGAKEHVESDYAVGPGNTITTTTTLGQTSVSTDVEDYSITADWIPCPTQVDGTDAGSGPLTQDGAIEYDLPQDAYRHWQETEVNLIEARWLRFRIISGAGIGSPTINRIRIDQGAQYLFAECTQGETIGPQLIGSSDGSGSQEFELPETPYLDDTETIEVDETGSGTFLPYTRVKNFLNSTATSRHYMRETDAEDAAKVIFGDGINGKIPPTGTDNIRASWRVGGDVDGNVGVSEVAVNADGVQGVSEVWNPRAAAGWRMKDGGTDTDLERVKREAPAALRTRDTAATAADVENLSVNSFTDRYGSKPIARAYAIEEGLGIKTVKLLVVGAGGTTLTTEQKDDCDTYFNGDRYASPPVSGVLVVNHELTTFNYEPELIAVNASVTWPGGNAESIRAALLALLTPLAVEVDGLTWVWDLGGSISRSRVYSEIHAVDPNIEDVPILQLDGVAASYALGAHGLPISQASSIVVSIQES